jgi:hypothetical protein
MLYRHVDLSCHRDMGRFVCYRDIYLSDIPPPEESDDLFSKLHRRQDLFFDAILTTPSRGELVLSLTWTYEWCDVHPRETGDRALRMGRAFALLSRIRKLDMCFFNRESSHICQAPRAPLRDLISGMGSAWDRVRGRTRTPDELFIITIHPREVLMSLDWFSTLDGDVDQRSAEVVFCKQLFGSTHTLNTALHYNVGVMSRWDRELRRYAGIAHFINSLRPTLTTLVLEHGIHVQSGQPVSLPHGSLMRVGRPKNAFLLSVLPALAEGPWPQLKTLSVRGLGPWLREQTQDGIHEHPYEYEDSETPADLEAAQDQVRAALGDDIRLYWEMATGRSLYPTLETMSISVSYKHGL